MSTNCSKRQNYPGLSNVFRRFTPNLARLAATLIKKLRKEQQTCFGLLTEEVTQSMNALKEALVSPTVAALPNLTCHMTKDIESLIIQVHCALLQDQVEDAPKQFTAD